MNQIIDGQILIDKVYVYKYVSRTVNMKITVYECELHLDNKQKINYFLDECELSESKYSKGKYEYVNGKFNLIEEWE